MNNHPNTERVICVEVLEGGIFERRKNHSDKSEEYANTAYSERHSLVKVINRGCV